MSRVESHRREIAGRAIQPSITRATAISMTLVGGLTFFVYAPGIAAGFVGDDFMILHRLRPLTGLSDLRGFFGAEFFEYYRPLGFVAHAVDYAIGGFDPRQFHVSNILLHIVNTVLVLFVGRRLSPHSLAGPIAALLFGLHASSHEAVMWISARFDLLATTFSLAALGWMMCHHRADVLPPVLFGSAVLSKESAVAVPVAAAGWAVFVLRADRGEALRRLLPWLLALGVCAAMRSAFGGLSATGGTNRLPKLLAFGLVLSAILLMAGQAWPTLKATLRTARRPIALACGMLLGAMVVAAWAANGPIGRLAAEKLTVGAFALFHLVSPVIEISDAPFQWDTASQPYWLIGAGGIALAAGFALALSKSWLEDDRVWFLLALLVATLLPISALTEGKRYLYLPSVPVSLLAGVLIAELRGTRFKLALAATVVFLSISIGEVRAKIADWRWAGGMTAEGALLVDKALAPACGTGHVVFITAPVGIRGVYTHFYYETFELPRGCMPEIFQVLIRVVRTDTQVDVRWDGPDRLVIATNEYRGNFLVSEDLRQFDRRVDKRSVVTVETPLGSLRTEPFGDSGQRFILTLSALARQNPPRYFFYGAGRIHALAAAPSNAG